MYMNKAYIGFYLMLCSYFSIIYSICYCMQPKEQNKITPGWGIKCDKFSFLASISLAVKASTPLTCDYIVGLLITWHNPSTTRGATVTGCASVVSFICKGLYKYNNQS